MTQDRPNIME